MTNPLPHENSESLSVLRKRWWQKYISIQMKTDMQIRTVLNQGAKDANARLNVLSERATFSAGVRSVQLNLAIREIKKTNHDIFGAILPIIKTRQKDVAGAAMDGLSETDFRYIRDLAGTTHNAESLLKSLRHSALLNVTHALQRIQKTDIPLSAQVYRSESLANRWVQNLINSSLLRGDGAKDLAKKVKSHILPSVPGGTSYAALRLGRTELNNAFHATAVTAAQDRPWITGMRWYVSETHIFDPNNIEICDTLNGRLFPVDEVPGKPHPQCRCFVAAEIESLAVFKQNLTSGVYRDWMINETAA